MAPTLGSLESSEQLIRDLYIDLRKKVNGWAKVTHQTAQARMGYVGQHLVSVVTGFRGGRSGARGKDLVISAKEYAEIKTCYRVDQLGKCEDCGSTVSSIETQCSACDSENIKRNDDSKWLIGIQHDAEFSQILSPSYYYLVLFDFTDLAKPETIRASIWRVDPLVPGFAYCVIDYYRNIKAKSSSGAPFNLWPFSLKFELMRPILIYRSLIQPDDSIQTQLFPNRDEPQLDPLSPMISFYRSSNLTTEKIRAFAKAVHIKLPTTDRKSELLQVLDVQIKKAALNGQAVVDALAVALYWPDIKGHIKGLPVPLVAQLKKVN